MVEAAGGSAQIVYTGGNRGWVGDVPRFQYSTAKLRQLGWAPQLNSEQAMQRAVTEVAKEAGLC